ncbi:MAG: hypothetical protein WC788_08840 [Candidatus Paceibacterota bacterium]|jgi:hypothetical protein
MPKFDKSEKIADVLKKICPEGCPVCGENAFEGRIIGGIKNGRNETFDERIICSNCGTDLTAESDQGVAPLKRSERDVIRQMRDLKK